MIPDRLPDLPPLPLPPDLALSLAAAPEAIARAAAHAHAHSPFLRALMRRRPDALAAFAAGDEWRTQPVSFDHASPAVTLRRARAALALQVALADIAALLSLEAVTSALSAFADQALSLAIATAIAERTPGTEPRGFVAISLGKHGSYELNYSSDLDLIFLFDAAVLPVRPGREPHEEAVRIARRVIELMQGRDAEGYVARIDLRLRPSPEATPIALPVGAAIHYYQAEALPWERAAFIRARASAGDLALGRQFLGEIDRFVWRRSLDFQAIREVQSISLRIRDHYDERMEVGSGFDLKRGRGGIREIEFFAQMHQMIYGGRDPALRAPATLDALATLAAAGRVSAADAATLAAAYRYLRAAEHRAQMVEDAQTHSIPEPEPQRENYARFCGYADWPAMAAALAQVTGAVAPIYDRVGERARTAPVAAPPQTEPLVAAWRAGERRCLRSDAARAAFAEIEPQLLAAFAASPDPRAAAARFDRFLTALPSGVGLFSLLAANPRLLDTLGQILTATPMLADALARRPDLFDILLDPGAMTELPDADTLAADLAARLARTRDHEELLEAVRRWTGERRFQFGAQLIENRADPLAVGRAYSDLADAGLAAIAAAVTAEFAQAHGCVPDARLIVIAMGRYGGRMLTSRSDLDLVYLHSGASDQQSDGRKPLHASTYFIRLGQRLSNALSVPTASGALYEIDTRLRPSGSKGALVVSLDAFARYQREEAWVAEHMALTRARIVHGDPADRLAAQAVIAAVLSAAQDPAHLRAQALALRAEIARHKPHCGELDVKLAPGGLVDLEFLAQVRQLETGQGLDPDLGAAIAAFIQCGQLPPGLLEAHDLLTRVLILLRLVFAATHGPVATPTSDALAFIARGAGFDDARSLRPAILAAMKAVRAAWPLVFNAEREDH